MKIFALAPTRIGLIGGGTDVEPFASKFGGKVLSIAIDLRHKATLTPRSDKKIFIKAMGQRRSFSLTKKLVYGEDPKFDLIYSVINYFKPKIRTGFASSAAPLRRRRSSTATNEGSPTLRRGGFTFVDKFEGVETAGLGSSGSAAVSMIAVFAQWLGMEMSKNKMALLAWKQEAEELGWISGKQDQLAATFGGINLLTFGPGKEKFSVYPLKLSDKTIRKLRAWSLLVFTGGQRHSAVLQKKLQKGMSEEKKIKALQSLKKAVLRGVEALRETDFERLGIVLDQAWEDKKRSNPAATNQRIDFLYNLAKKKGALGGKIMGAGGEGHMFFLCSPDKQKGLIEALKKEKVKKVNFNFDFEGLKVKVA